MNFVALATMAAMVSLSSTCEEEVRTMRPTEPEVLWSGEPVGLAVAPQGSAFAVADTGRDIIVVMQDGRRIAQVDALHRGFDTMGASGDLLVFSRDGRELAWVEYDGDSAVLRILDLARGAVKNVPLGLPKVPRVAQLKPLPSGGYIAVSWDGQSRRFTDGRVETGRSLPRGGLLVDIDGDLWTVEPADGVLELHRPDGSTQASIPVRGMVSDVAVSGTQMAIATSGVSPSGLTDRLFFVELSEGPKLVASLPFEATTEMPWRLAWNGPDLVVLFAEGKIRVYTPPSDETRFQVSVGEPNGGAVEIQQGAAMVRTASSIRRLPLPETTAMVD